LASEAGTRDGERRGRGSPLERLDRVFDEGAGSVLLRGDYRTHAVRSARAFEAAANSPRAAPIAAVMYATDVFIGQAVEFAAAQEELQDLIERIDSRAGIPRAVLARAVLGAPSLLQLPTAVAIEVELALVLAFTGARAVSLWTLEADGELRYIAHSGAFDAAASQTRLLARKLLGDELAKSERTRDVAGIRIECWHRPTAALIARGREAATPTGRAMLEGAGPMLTAMLERDELLARGTSADAALLASAERRLSRLRFDLHDGPQQDVVLLGEDVALLRSQLEVAIKRHPNRARLLGRLDDLQARLVAIDGDLRRISAFLQSPFLQSEPVPVALGKITAEFAARTGIEPETHLKGDFRGLTDSQQITLLGLIREALSNVREHSEAQQVTIRLFAGRRGVEASVTDDGRGFDPESTLVRAARGGHLGLVGMHERVRLLGGRTRIESRTGGPTVISMTLPPFDSAAEMRGT
jgi:signal transduction histidine kinase